MAVLSLYQVKLLPETYEHVVALVRESVEELQSQVLPQGRHLADMVSLKLFQSIKTLNCFEISIGFYTTCMGYSWRAETKTYTKSNPVSYYIEGTNSSDSFKNPSNSSYCSIFSRF